MWNDYWLFSKKRLDALMHSFLLCTNMQDDGVLVNPCSAVPLKCSPILAFASLPKRSANIFAAVAIETRHRFYHLRCEEINKWWSELIAKEKPGNAENCFGIYLMEENIVQNCLHFFWGGQNKSESNLWAKEFNSSEKILFNKIIHKKLRNSLLHKIWTRANVMKCTKF